MNRFSGLSCLLLLTIFLAAGCAGGKPVREGTCEVLLPMPPGPVDPPDMAVRETVGAILARTGAPAASTYDINRYDLNGDGRRDALVLFKTPYGYWCGTHGCTMMVLRAGDKSFTLLGDVQPVRAPVYVAETAHNGWRDLILRVSGRWSETKDVALQFDGARYPANPDSLPAYLRYASNDDARLFYK